MRLLDPALAMILTALLAAAPPAQAQGGPPPAKVYVDTARVMTVETFREATGDLRPARRAVVASRQEGLVAAFNLQEGDFVRAGDVLAELEADLLRFEVDRVRAQTESDRGLIEERRAELENAENDLARLIDLSDRGSARPVELDDARTDAARAAAQLKQAEADLAADLAELAIAERRLRDASIVAPFDGRVVATMTELGEWITSGGAVCEIIALDTLECWLNAPEAALDILRRSDEPLTIRIDALRMKVAAPVDAVIPDINPLSRLFRVRLLLDNADERLAPGMSVTGLTPTGVRGDELTIHGDAVRFDNLGEFVYYDRGGVAGVARVQTLYTVGDRVVIRGGALREGERVVVEGNERLNPGQPLIILGEGSPASRVAEREEGR